MWYSALFIDRKYFVFSWFYDSAEIYSSMILVYLVCSMLFMACTIFQLDLVGITILKMPRRGQWKSSLKKDCFCFSFFWCFDFKDFILNAFYIYAFQQLQHIDFSFLLLSFAFAISASNIFVYCYFGKMATESYRDMANCLFEANWHEYPVEIQKYFILFIANAQKPVYYHGSKIVTLDLEMFTRVS